MHLSHFLEFSTQRQNSGRLPIIYVGQARNYDAVWVEGVQKRGIIYGSSEDIDVETRFKYTQYEYG